MTYKKNLINYVNSDKIGELLNLNFSERIDMEKFDTYVLSYSAPFEGQHKCNMHLY